MQRTQEKSQTTPDLSKKYECEICKDLEFIYNAETNSTSPCKCKEKKVYKRMLEASGIGEGFLNIGFKEFEASNEKLIIAKKTAIKYVKDFEKIKYTKNNSIAFLGNPGSGKSHLSIAIANNLMAKNIGVLYMPYRDVMAKLAQCRFNEENYQKEINKYKMASVLLIDDLFKGLSQKRNEFEINTMFEIINHRYLNLKPMIISSEFNTDILMDFDEAIASRIVERCKGRITVFEGKEFNYRLKVQ